jgi:GT2 family glycosyltransferase
LSHAYRITSLAGKATCGFHNPESTTGISRSGHCLQDSAVWISITRNPEDIMPDLTLSIVTYNNEPIIRKVIDSILDGMTPMDEGEGDLPSFRIIVIDNASTDDTIQVVRTAQSQYPGLIECLPQKVNRGFGAGHNRAIPLMKSAYHAVVNPDIVVPCGALLDMIRFMDTNPDIGLLTPKVVSPDNSLQYLCKHHPTFLDLFLRLALKGKFRKRQDWFEMRETRYDHVFDVEYATGCFMFFRTEVFLQIHGFDEKFFLYLEDADITRRVNEVARTVFYPCVQVVHEWQRDQHRKIALMWVNVKSWLHYWWKWHRRSHRRAHGF